MILTVEFVSADIRFIRQNISKRHVNQNGKWSLFLWKRYLNYIYIYNRNETFTTKVFGSSILELLVRDHNTLADVDIGEASINIANYVNEGKPFDGWLPLSPSGNGEIHVQVEIIH